MPTRRVGIIASGEAATIVDVEVPDDPSRPITLISDDTWRLQKGDRASAYAVLHQRCADYLRENGIAEVVVKASALSTSGVKLSHLESAEVRGVIIAAAATACRVKVLAKAAISRNFGDRKVDEYLKDESFWAVAVAGGKLRKTSREAAMLLIAARGSQ